MAAKPFPDFSDRDLVTRSPRTKLHMLREFVLNHEGPIPQADARRLMVQMCTITIELIGQTHSPSKFEMDRGQAERLLREEMAMYARDSS